MKSSIPVLLLILSAAAFYFYISPGYEEIVRLRAEVEQYESALADAQALAAVRDSLVTTYNNFSSEDLAHLEKMLPVDIDTVRLAAEINSIGQKYGTSITGFDVVQEQLPTEEENIQAPFRTLIVTFSFQSTYDNFRKFLSDLESNIHISDVSEIGFQQKESSGRQTYLLSLKMYALSK